MATTDNETPANSHSDSPADDAPKGAPAEGGKPKTSARSKSTSTQGNTLAVKTKEESTAIEVAQPRFLLGNRPIEPTTLKVLDMTPVGNRPIFASEIQVVNSDLLPGHRPIMASSADLLNAAMLLGNRPIAANDIDDPLTLMGYLD